MATWVLVLVMLNPGDAHATTARVVQASQSACEASKARILTANAQLRASGYAQQVVVMCTGPRS